MLPLKCTGVCSPWELNQKPAGLSKCCCYCLSANTAQRHMQGCSDLLLLVVVVLLLCSGGQGTLACSNLMLLLKAIEGGSECVFVQMLLPANNQKEVLKPVSPLSNRGRKKVRLGFLVLRYSWVSESLLRITISHPSHGVAQLWAIRSSLH